MNNKEIMNNEWELIMIIIIIIIISIRHNEWNIISIRKWK